MRQALLLVIIAGATCLQAADRADSRPNILFIMSDDHAAHGLSCYGSQIISTPQIDRLAREGMRFTTAVGVNSLCAPSRAILLTGKYSHANGMLNNLCRFDSRQQTFPKLLQAAGYETAVIGKWHLGDVESPPGFDYYHVLRDQGRYVDPELRETGRRGWRTEKGYLTNIITDSAVRWLTNRRSDKPFCLMVHHKAVHGPDIHEPRHAKLFEDGPIAEPNTLHDDWATREPLRTGRCHGSKLINCHWQQDIYLELMASAPKEKRPRTSAVYQQMIKGYMRLVASLDENVGRLLDYVEQSGLRDNTIVIYTSDNGFFLGDHGLFNKMWMYEESMKIPLLVRYPGVVKPGAVNDDLVCNLDFASTFLDIAGAEIPADMQGRSIRPLLLGNRPSDWRKAVYYHYYEQYEVPEQYGIRTLTHKLVHFPNYGEGNYWELFDLKEDPHELTNVYGNPAFKSVAGKLHRELQQLELDVKAPRTVRVVR